MQADAITSPTIAEYQAAKSERRTLRRTRVDALVTETCTRCAGAGGSDMWKFTGWTCFDCQGVGTRDRLRRVYTTTDATQRDEDLTNLIDAYEWEQQQAEIAANAEKRASERYDADWDAAREEYARREQIAAMRDQQRWLGEVGTKIEATGRIQTAFTVKTFYGSNRLVIIKTDDGNYIKIFGTGSTLWGIDEDEAVTVTGTIKELSVYEGDKQTVLTRAKIHATHPS